jgi:hypothetical protein
MDETQKAAGVLFRYLLAKARYKKADIARSLAGLEYEIGQGVRVFGAAASICIDPKASSVITIDADDDAFLRAIRGDDGALKVDEAYLKRLREYVLEGAGEPPSLLPC